MAVIDQSPELALPPMDEALHLTAAIDDVYSEMGLEWAEPADIYVHDGTVAFASCTASRFRYAMAGAEQLERGQFTVQPCARFQSLKGLGSSKAPEWTSHFRMYGGFEPSGERGHGYTMLRHQQSLSSLLDRIGIDKGRLAIVGASISFEQMGVPADDITVNLEGNPFGHEDLLPHPAPDSPVVATLGHNALSSMDWKYGNNITGHGLSIYIANPDNLWVQVGNIIAVRDTNGQVTGVDFGGGIETTLRALYGGGSNHYWSGMLDRFGIDPRMRLSDNHLNLLDATEAALIMQSYPESMAHTLSVVRRDFNHALRAIMAQSEYLQLDREALRSLVYTYTGSAGMETEVGTELLRKVDSDTPVRQYAA